MFQAAPGHAVVDHGQGVPGRDARADLGPDVREPPAGLGDHVHRAVRQNDTRDFDRLLHDFPAHDPGFDRDRPERIHALFGRPARFGVLPRPARQHAGAQREHGNRCCVPVFHSDSAISSTRPSRLPIR